MSYSLHKIEALQGAGCDCSMENCVLKLSPSVSNISSKYHMRFYFEITDGRLLRPTQKEFQPQISITPVSKTGASFIKYQTMPQHSTCDIFCSFWIGVIITIGMGTMVDQVLRLMLLNSTGNIVTRYPTADHGHSYAFMTHSVH